MKPVFRPRIGAPRYTSSSPNEAPNTPSANGPGLPSPSTAGPERRPPLYRSVSKRFSAWGGPCSGMSKNERENPIHGSASATAFPLSSIIEPSGDSQSPATRCECPNAVVETINAGELSPSGHSRPPRHADSRRVSTGACCGVRPPRRGYQFVNKSDRSGPVSLITNTHWSVHDSPCGNGERKFPDQAKENRLRTFSRINTCIHDHVFTKQTFVSDKQNTAFPSFSFRAVVAT